MRQDQAHGTEGQRALAEGQESSLFQSDIPETARCVFLRGASVTVFIPSMQSSRMFL